MSDDRIIDFNELKNKVKETDIDKFENYMYELYFSVADGSMTMSEFTSKIYDYMRENNISNEKFMNIQKKLLERYGVDEAEIERQLKSMGINPNDLNSMGSMNINDIRNYTMNANNNSQEPKVEVVSKDDIKETIVKNSDFYNKFSKRLEYDSFIISHLKNDVNDLKIVINKEKVTLMSAGSINLVDSQLNEFLLDYKNMIGKKMKVTICENCKEYDY
ncbi:MAG: DUF3867 domain-containing protein [Intestinibacter sp.]|uniref:DUF3867 domain-containing protein n=1 Tax=Intestinibacter sp. TaxID=1965304 RepID=UPI0025C10A3B|nr:DUF3867 domain-containing protein [Intestinibacter sp.]MCI6737973.1 DUF3867 domain-containing protein [Intestinibacter sp.]